MRRIAITVCWLCTAAVVGAAEPAGEYEVKAAYLYNFANFVTWPPAAFDGANSPFRVCIASPDPFGPAIADTMATEAIDGHAVTVERIGGAAGLRRCQILFVPAGASNGAELLRALGDAPVLAVGESDRFLRDGGTIRLVVENGHVTFEINRTSATRRGLMVSSRLLGVARRVM